MKMPVIVWIANIVMTLMALIAIATATMVLGSFCPALYRSFTVCSLVFLLEIFTIWKIWRGRILASDCVLMIFSISGLLLCMLRSHAGLPAGVAPYGTFVFITFLTVLVLHKSSKAKAWFEEKCRQEEAKRHQKYKKSSTKGPYGRIQAHSPRCNTGALTDVETSESKKVVLKTTFKRTWGSRGISTQRTAMSEEKQKSKRRVLVEWLMQPNLAWPILTLGLFSFAASYVFYSRCYNEYGTKYYETGGWYATSIVLLIIGVVLVVTAVMSFGKKRE